MFYHHPQQPPLFPIHPQYMVPMGQPPQYMGQPPPYPLCLPAAPVEAHQGVRTIYVKGFPLDTQERELYNAVATQNGFEDFTYERRKHTIQVWARYKTPESARFAVANLNGHLFDKWQRSYLEVQLANAEFRAPRSVSGYSEEGGPLNRDLGNTGSVFNPGDNPRCSTLYLGNLCPEAKHSELVELFEGRPGFQAVYACPKGEKYEYFVDFADDNSAEAVHDTCQVLTIPSNRRRAIRIQYAKAKFGDRFRFHPNASTAPGSVKVEAPEIAASAAVPEGGEASESTLSPTVAEETPETGPAPPSPERLPTLKVGGAVQFPVRSENPPTPSQKTPTSALDRQLVDSRSSSEEAEGAASGTQMQKPQVSKDGGANVSSAVQGKAATVVQGKAAAVEHDRIMQLFPQESQV